MLVNNLSSLFFLILFKVLHSFKVYGKENIPKNGAIICASNHVSNGDPAAIGAAALLIRAFHFMAKEELFHEKTWGWWFKAIKCIPISRNKKDHKATRTAVQLLKQGRSIALFPEGTRSRTGELQEPEIGVGFLADKSGAPIIPTFIKGTNKALSIEYGYKAGAPVSVYFGKPVDIRDAKDIQDRRQRYAFISKQVMRDIKKLKDMAQG